MLDPLPARSVSEGSLLTFTATAADPDLPETPLTFTLVNPPAGAVMDPLTGVFQWTPAESQGQGVHSVTVRVSDGGTPPLADEQTVWVTVNEVDNPPVIVPLPPVSVREGQSLVVKHQAADPDTPPAILRFSLPAGAPAGVRLDPMTGVMTWDTTEDDGPGSHLIVVRVSQSGASALSDQFTLGVTVEEDNQAPVLSGIADVTVDEGGTVSLLAVGTDSDRPPQVLTYSLGLDAPAGSLMDPVTGAFAWTADADAGASTQTVTVRVSDNGPGGLSASQSFRIVTRPRFRVAIQEVMSHPSTLNGQYIELANPSATTPWSLAGLRLTGLGLSYSFPAGFTLSPGAAVCVVHDLTAFRGAYGPQPTVAGTWTGALVAAGDVLRLVRPGTAGVPDAVLDEFRFEAADPWPASARGGGAALQVMDVRRDNTRVGNWSAAASYNGPRDLIAMNREWRYFQSGPVEASWKNPGFDDGAWPAGQGLLYVESAELPEPKNTTLTLGQLTYYFRTTFVLPSAPVGAQLVLRTVLDDGAVFYLNGREIHRQNMDPAATVDFNTPAVSAVGDAELVGPFVLSGADLVAGTNVLAVEVHQVNAGSSDIVFGCSLNLEGGNVPAFTPGQPNTVALDLPEFPAVWVSEILPNSVNGIVDGQGEVEPWLEIVNRGDSEVHLDGWALSNSAADLGRWKFPSGAILRPRSHTVIYSDGQPGQTAGGEWHTSFRLDASSGLVLLSRTQPGGLAVVDYLRYSGLQPDQSSVPNANAPAGTGLPAEPSPGTETGAGPNRPPTLNPVSDRTVSAGIPMLVTLSATDPDVGQTLAYSLVSGPATLTVSPGGDVRWNPSSAQAGANPVRVRVRDNGVPALSDERTFIITVTDPSRPELTVQLTGNQLELLLPTVSGRSYRVEVADELSGDWQSLQGVTGTGNVLKIIDPSFPASAQRFYRALLLP